MLCRIHSRDVLSQMLPLGFDPKTQNLSLKSIVGNLVFVFRGIRPDRIEGKCVCRIPCLVCDWDASIMCRRNADGLFVWEISATIDPGTRATWPASKMKRTQGAYLS